MDHSFANYLKELNKLAISYANKDKQVVEDKYAIICEYIISHIKLASIEDVVIFCIANNLLNTYVKQENALFGYYFKASVFKLVHELKEITDLPLTLSFQRDNGNTLLVVEIENAIQFSYHGVAKIINNMIPVNYASNIKWDGIRKQKCALTLYLEIIEHFKNNLAIKKIISDGEELANLFQNKKCDANHIKSICRLPDYCYRKKELTK